MIVFLKNCLQHNNNGFILRIVLTLISFEILKQYKNDKYFLIILPVLLTVLDLADNAFVKYAEWKKSPSLIFNRTNCTTKSRYYQNVDKIIDMASYILAYLYFYDVIKDTLLEYFIAFRFIGVTMFLMTSNKYYLVIFFDFVKEYMLYKYFFNNNSYVLIICMILKILFEYVMHIKMNQV